MKPIRTGLAAFGLSGEVFHAPFLASDPRYELTAICERHRENSRVRYPAARLVRSFEELLAVPGLELVVVNTPVSTHATYTRMALEAGLHVVVEKPFVPTWAEAEELAALADKKGLMLSVYQNRRWDGDFLTVKQILQEGTLGRIVEFESTFARFRSAIRPNSWKENDLPGNGLTYDLGAHLVDQAVELFGMPEAVWADIARLRDGARADDYFTIRLLNPERAPAVKVTLKASYLMCIPEPRFVIHGTEGSYVKYGEDPQERNLKAGCMPGEPHWNEEPREQWGMIRTQGRERTNDSQTSHYQTLSGDYGKYYDNIYRYLHEGVPLSVTARQAARTIRIIEAAYESCRCRQTVVLAKGN